MTRQQIHSSRFILTLVASVLCLGTVAQAGPPLICHTIEIGQAKSLPWMSHNWNLSGAENYDTKSLVGDTLEILAPETPTLVRMETLRRATLYARKDPAAAKELFARLRARATLAESSGHPDALAWFDVGYLAEAYKQWIGRNLPHMTDGYAMVKKALALRAASQYGEDAQMEFAAALITLSGPLAEHRAHTRTAMAGAKTDALLAQNLATHFAGPQTESMSQLLAKN
jgi:hypothetical protein